MLEKNPPPTTAENARATLEKAVSDPVRLYEGITAVYNTILSMRNDMRTMSGYTGDELHALADAVEKIETAHGFLQDREKRFAAEAEVQAETREKHIVLSLAMHLESRAINDLAQLRAAVRDFAFSQHMRYDPPKGNDARPFIEDLPDGEAIKKFTFRDQKQIYEYAVKIEDNEIKIFSRILMPNKDIWQLPWVELGSDSQQ